jgi:hypothetical protein
MHRMRAAGLIAICVFGASVIVADDHEVVSNPPTALSATMTLFTDSNNFSTWTVQGKVSPHFRGVGANVHLLCVPFANLTTGLSGVQVWPASTCANALDCASDPANVDSCGSFSFQIVPSQSTLQLDNTFYCAFVVHADSTKTPPPCSSVSPPPAVVSDSIVDPNGSAACSGGYCPTAP